MTNYNKCGVINLFSKEVNLLPATSNFVTLCKKDLYNGETYDKCEIAKLLISSEDKT
ncbi:MAG: hypothetical protein P8X70_01270 [Nanoarchaeota archaeon]